MGRAWIDTAQLSSAWSRSSAAAVEARQVLQGPRHLTDLQGCCQHFLCCLHDNRVKGLCADF